MTTWRPSDRPRARPDVESTTVAGELVLWDPRFERVHRLDPIASLLWPLLDGTVAVDELSEDVADVWAVPVPEAEAALLDLVSSLEQAELLARPDHQHEPTTSAGPDDRQITNPNRCGTDLSGWSWGDPVTIEVGDATIAFRTSDPTVTASLREALAAQVAEPTGRVNYSLALARHPGELHLLFWGHCLVARCRDVPEAITTLLAHLRGHGPIPARAVRFDGHLLVSGGRGVLFPANARSLLWAVAARLRRDGASIAPGPWVDVRGDGAVVTHPAALAVDGVALEPLLDGRPADATALPPSRLEAMYVPSWMASTPASALAVSLIQERLVLDPGHATALLGELVERVELVVVPDDPIPAVTERVCAALTG